MNKLGSTRKSQIHATRKKLHNKPRKKTQITKAKQQINLQKKKKQLMNRNCSIPCTMVMFTCKRMVCRVSISVSVLTNAAETKCSSYKYTFVPTDSSITKFRVSIVQSSYNSPYKHYEHYQMLQHAVIFTSLCSVASYLTRMRIISLLALSRNAKALLTYTYTMEGSLTHLYKGRKLMLFWQLQSLENVRL